MKTTIRFVSVIALTFGFCGIVSAAGDKPIEQAIPLAVSAPPAAFDCCFPPCPPNCPTLPPGK